MRAVVLALVMLLLSGEALASGAAWHGRRVRVWNHAGIEWAPSLREGIAAVNRALPKRAPRFVYRQGGATCRGHRRAIAVCSSGDIGAAFGKTTSRLRRHHLTRSRIVLRPFAEYTDPLVIVCHELGHAVAGIPESRVPDEPCPFDEAFARRVYRKHGR